MTTNQNQSILLAGASGVLGRHVARALTDAGHKVTGLGRSEGNGVRADLMDREALLRAVDGQHFDTVVHAATALRKPPMRHRDMYATDALRIEGTAHLVEAARATGARRFVTESMVFGYGYGDFGDRPVTEDDEFAPRGTDPELERHLAGMRTKEQLTFEAAGLEGIALRFGLFYGPGGTDNVLALLRKRQLPAPPTTAGSCRGSNSPTRPARWPRRSYTGARGRRTTSWTAHRSASAPICCAWPRSSDCRSR